MIKTTVWDISSLDEGDIPSLLSKVTDERKQKALKFHFKEDQIRSLCSEILLRNCLMDEFDISLKDYRILYNDFHKPYLEGLNQIHFNISHSGDKVALVISTSNCGIDVEQIRPIDLSITNRFFTLEEQKNINNALDSQSEFYNFWVLKEAYIKAIGEGLYCSLDSFKIVLNGENAKLEFSKKELLDLYLNSEISGYKLAVAGTFDLTPTIKFTSHEDILSDYTSL